MKPMFTANCITTLNELYLYMNQLKHFGSVTYCFVGRFLWIASTKTWILIWRTFNSRLGVHWHICIRSCLTNLTFRHPSIERLNPLNFLIVFCVATWWYMTVHWKCRSTPQGQVWNKGKMKLTRNKSKSSCHESVCSIDESMPWKRIIFDSYISLNPWLKKRLLTSVSRCFNCHS